MSSETLTYLDHYEALCCAVEHAWSNLHQRTGARYMARERPQAVKVEHFIISWSTSILLVRDRTQGLYSGLNTIDSAQKTVSRSSYFNKRVFEDVLPFSLARTRETWDSVLQMWDMVQEQTVKQRSVNVSVVVLQGWPMEDEELEWMSEHRMGTRFGTTRQS